MQTPIIVTFANQKGGVGKTSLCVAFANYLAVKGVRVIAVDCDRQKSIMKWRQADINAYGQQVLPYDVEYLSLDDHNTVLSAVATLRNDPTVEVVVLDAPGNNICKGLLSLLLNSDVIAIPFHYDKLTVASTADFLLLLDELNERMNGAMKASLFMIPNFDNPSVGTADEKILWEDTKMAFDKYGTVTPKLPWRANMTRYSTIANLDSEFVNVKPAFSTIYSAMFGTLRNRRNHRLSEISISRKKKKYSATTNTQEPETQSSVEEDTDK